MLAQTSGDDDEGEKLADTKKFGDKNDPKF